MHSNLRIYLVAGRARSPEVIPFKIATNEKKHVLKMNTGKNARQLKMAFRPYKRILTLDLDVKNRNAVLSRFEY